MQFCSLSTVQRWVYLICDHCCGDLNIDMVPGLHCPKSADVKGKYRTFWCSRKETNKTVSILQLFILSALFLVTFYVIFLAISNLLYSTFSVRF